MKKKSKQIVFFLLLLIVGCSPLKESMIKNSENMKDAAIYNAILDFSLNCNLFKKYNTFYVSFEDSVFNEGSLERADKNIYGCTHIWKNGSLINDIVAVQIISEDDSKYYYSEETKNILPSRGVIIKDKLFLWRDEDYPVTEEMISILFKYDLLQTEDEFHFVIDECLKGANYFFCKNNLSNYKRVITNIALGYYKPPKLECE